MKGESRTQSGDTTMSGLTIETGILNVSLGSYAYFLAFCKPRVALVSLKW